MGEPIGDKYRIDRVIGHGELAMAFEATHMVLGEKVALKVLLPRWADHQPLLARYLQQGRAASHVHDEHVERVLDLGTHHEAPYLVTEYLEGTNLGELVEDLGPVAIPDAIDHVLQAIEALADGRAMGVDHKDLRTRDLFLTHRPDGSGCVKVLDFGISKTRPRSADDSSGVWAVGGVLYELLTGLPPFLPSFGAYTDPPRPLSMLRLDVPEALEATVMMCLEQDPVERFQSVAEVALALPEFGSPWAHASVEKIVRALRSAARPSFPEGPRRIATPVPRPSTLAPTTGTLAPPPDDVAEFDGAWRRKSGLRFAAAGFVGLAALTAIFGWIALRMHESVTEPSAALPAAVDTRLAPPPAPPPPTTTAPPASSPSKAATHPPSPSPSQAPSSTPSPAPSSTPSPSLSSTASVPTSRPSPAARSRGHARPSYRVERSDATEAYPLTPAPPPPTAPPPPPAPSPPSEIVTTSPFDTTTPTAPPAPPPSSRSTGGAADPPRLFEDRK